MASGATYNVTRFTRQVLKRYRRSPPSVVVHLYPNHFRFEHQHGNFGYDSPMKCFLESIREQKLPTDLLDVLDSASVPYYDGCLIVEVHDHRQYYPQPSTSSTTSSGPGGIMNLSMSNLPPSKLFTFSITPSSQEGSCYNQKAEVYRIVLAPNPATLWTELGILSNRLEQEEEDGIEGSGGGLSQEQAVKMESIILNRTVPPLCLDPSIQTSRIANSMLRATTLRPPKRKRFCNSGECDNDDDNEANTLEDQEEDGEAAGGVGGGAGEMSKKERDQYEKLMKVGDEGIAKLKGPAFSRLAFIQSYRERQSNPHAAQAQTQQANQASASSSSVPLKAQPGSAITSIRLGSSQTQRAASPAVSSVSSHRPQNVNKKRSHAAGGGGGDMSDGATSTASLQSSSTAQLKKQKKSSATDAGMTEKKREKLNAKKKEKERKRLEAAAQAQAVAGGGDLGGNPQAKFTWSGSPQ
ncbi:hypothetical protein JCM3765_007237 [Sporobolomyces pararoseus]